IASYCRPLSNGAARWRVQRATATGNGAVAATWRGCASGTRQVPRAGRLRPESPWRGRRLGHETAPRVGEVRSPGRWTSYPPAPAPWWTSGLGGPRSGVRVPGALRVHGRDVLAVGGHEFGLELVHLLDVAAHGADVVEVTALAHGPR